MFARQIAAYFFRDTSSLNHARELSGVLDCLTHILLLYAATALGVWDDARIEVGVAEGVLAICSGAGCALVTFFVLRRLQQACIKTFGDPLGGSLTPSSVRGLPPIVGLLLHVVLRPIAEEMFFRRLLLGRVGAIMPMQ